MILLSLKPVSRGLTELRLVACVLIAAAMMMTASTAYANTAQQPILLKQVLPEFAPALRPSAFVSSGNKLFFRGVTTEHGDELWVSDGTAAGTHLVKDIVSGATGSKVALGIAWNGGVLFPAVQSAEHSNDQALWFSDGSASGTRVVKDIRTLDDDWSEIGNFTLFENLVYFSGTDGTRCGLWKTDGSAESTVQVVDVTAAGDYLTNPSCAPSTKGINSVGANSGGLFYSTYAKELWKLSGSTPNLVEDSDDFKALPGGGSSFHPWGAYMFFNATGWESGDTNTMWRSDGTPTGTQKVLDNSPGSSQMVFNDKLYLKIKNKFNVIDSPTAAPRELVLERPGATDIWPEYFTAFNGSVYFVAGDGVSDLMLWKTDGATVTPVRDIPNPQDKPDVKGITVVGNVLYMNIDYNATKITSVLKTDGSTATPLSGWNFSETSSIFALNNQPVFAGLLSSGWGVYTIAEPTVSDPSDPKPDQPNPTTKPPLPQVITPSAKQVRVVPGQSIRSMARTGTLRLRFPKGQKGSTVRVVLAIPAKTARALKLRVKPRQKTVVIGSARLVVKKAGTTTIAVRLTAPAKRALGTQRQLKTISVTSKLTFTQPKKRARTVTVRVNVRR